MKCADIPDEHVLDLARRWQADPWVSPGVCEALMDEGVPRKVALRKVERLTDRGLLEYGTSPAYAWPADG